VRPSSFLKILGDELEKNTYHLVKVELRKRIGLGILNNICKNSKIKFFPWGFNHQGFDAINIKDNFAHDLEVADIHIGLVRRASRLAKTDQLSDESASTIVWTSSIESLKNRERKEIAFVSGMAASIRPKTHLALSVRLSKPAIKVPGLILENLLITKDELIESIHNGNVSIVGLLLDRYLLIIRSFLSAMKSYNVRYTANEAEHEGGLFFDWYVLRQIERDFSSILEESLRSTNREIIHQVIDFSLDAIYLADEYRDHLVFKRFARFYPHIYVTSTRLMNDISLREFVYERTWRSLQNYSLRILSRLEDSDISPEDITTYGGYILEIAYIFNDFLKLSIDLKDLIQFESYGRTFGEMMDWLNNPPSQTVKDLEWSLSRVVDTDQRDKIELKLSRSRELAKVEDDFIITRNLVWMGLGGWLTHLMDSNKFSPEDYRKWADIVAEAFKDIETLYKTYVIDSFSQNKIIRIWSSWDLQESELMQRGALVISDFDKSRSWIAKYYCQRGIELSSSRVNISPEILPTNNSKYIVDYVSGIVNSLNSSSIWTKTFNFPIDKLENRSNNFIELHQLMYERQKNADEEAIINSPLDAEIITQFKSKLVSSWKESSVIRALIKRSNNYQERSDFSIPSDSNIIGQNLLEPKAAFIKQDKIIFSSWAEDHGVSLSASEDTQLIKTLIRVIPTIDIELSKLESIIYEKLGEFQEKGLDPIVLCNQSKLRGTLFRSKNFTYSWNMTNEKEIGINEFIGTLDRALVFNIREIEDMDILIVDFNSLSELIQYRYKEESEYPLSITITSIDKNAAERLLVDNQDHYIDQETGERLEKEKAVRNLMLRVHLQVFLRYKLDIMDASSGVRVRILQK
jgi:hypothetical protein